jgi:hypothetical protein
MSLSLLAHLFVRYRTLALRQPPLFLSLPLPMIDAPDALAVLRLVRTVGKDSAPTEALLDRLESILARFPPSERVMQRLSLMQQAHDRAGDEVEFALVCMQMAAWRVLLDGPRRRRPRRRRSAPTTTWERYGARYGTVRSA